jgi:Undecaprenyl-phosphate glucose phosphotransferase
MRNETATSKEIVAGNVLQSLEQSETAAGASAAAGPAGSQPLISPRVLVALVRTFECLLVTLLGMGFWLFHPGAEVGDPGRYLPVTIGTGLALATIAQFAGLYNVQTLLRPVEQIAKLSVIWVLLFAALAALAFFTKAGEEFSRLWLGSWYAAGLALLFIYRTAVSRIIRRWNKNGRLARRAVLVGGGEAAGQIIDALRNSPATDVSIAGIFDDRSGIRSPDDVSGLRRLGNIADLIDFVRRTRVDLLIVTFPLTAESRLVDVLRRLWILPVDIRLSAYTQKLRYRPRAYSYVGNVPFLDVMDKPLTDWSGFLKAAEDKILACLALLLLSPLMLLIGLAVKLESRGPVFFRQKRLGFNNEVIDMFKFRSMYTELADAYGDKLTTRNDPRVTRVGKWIRKSSLDELPQLFNVLKGELSLVGPRPHPMRAKARDTLYDEAVEGYFARHKVKPGITGWAQINGWRGETDTEEKIRRRVEHDLYYIENWSLALDLLILLKTPKALFEAENAY